MIRIQQFKGSEIKPWLTALAGLRIAVFRDFPYLYDGSLEYEMRYLGAYVDAANSIAVLAFDDERVVGASTGLPMADETPEFKAPFVKLGFDPARIFYCAESVLLKEYRGQGVYKHFFTRREEHAQGLGCIDWCCFCGVQRFANHPLRPSDYLPLDEVWARFGYVKRADIVTSYRWKDIDQDAETDHEMVYWMKRIGETRR